MGGFACGRGIKEHLTFSMELTTEFPIASEILDG